MLTGVTELDGQPAIRVGGQSVAYGELREAAAAVAAKLEGAARVAVWAQPSLEFCVAAVAAVAAGVTDEDVALIVYTSGTTGRPKGALLSRRAIASNLDAIAEAWAWSGDDVLVHGLPLFHAHGLVLGLFGPLRVGDLATRDPDGYWRIVGRRATDLIKTGGYRVGAGEIEVALLDHPRVLEAAVTGEPDSDLGERIIAWVVADGNRDALEQELAAHVASELAPHKRPREVRFLQELPRNALGKVIKRRLGS